MVFADLRKDYSLAGMAEADVDADPFAQFRTWFGEAQGAKGSEPNAMTVATAGADGMPSARTVLLKGLDHGFIFYSNYASAKGRNLAENPRAELLFYWAEVERQVRVAGRVERVDRAAADAYFHSRPRGSQISAAVSPQSAVVPNREALEAETERFERSLDGGEVPMPDEWGGFRVMPTTFEFWQGRKSRLHDRLRYTAHDGGVWTVERLAP